MGDKGLKIILFSLLGAFIFGATCIGITWGIGALFGPLYQGEEEANRNFGYFLVAFSFFVIAGAGAGFYYGKNRN